MSRLLWLTLGALGGYLYATRPKELTTTGMTGKTSMRGATGTHVAQHRRGDVASTSLGAGSADLNRPKEALASTAYPAGTADLPRSEQVIRGS